MGIPTIRSPHADENVTSVGTGTVVAVECVAVEHHFCAGFRVKRIVSIIVGLSRGPTYVWTRRSGGI